MKIAVVAANGKAAGKIIAEAVARNHETTGFGRRDNNTVAQNWVKKDIFDLTAEDLAGFDAVVDAFGAWTPETLPLHSDTLKRLCDLLANTNTRLVVVGGAGSLFVNPEHTLQVADSPDFPDEYKPIAFAQAKSLKEIRDRNDVKWTYVSPACDFQADGERTGAYALAGEELSLDANGESVISYADYAIAVLDEIEKGDHIRERISVRRP